MTNYEKETGVKYRGTEAAEKLDEMKAHKGKCKHCGFVVKMLRDSITLQLLPKNCWCILCGQRYYMEIEDIGKWEIKQWNQKATME